MIDPLRDLASLCSDREKSKNHSGYSCIDLHSCTAVPIGVKVSEPNHPNADFFRWNCLHGKSRFSRFFELFSLMTTPIRNLKKTTRGISTSHLVTLEWTHSEHYAASKPTPQICASTQWSFHSEHPKKFALPNTHGLNDGE